MRLAVAQGLARHGLSTAAARQEACRMMAAFATHTLLTVGAASHRAVVLNAPAAVASLWAARRYLSILQLNVSHLGSARETPASVLLKLQQVNELLQMPVLGGMGMRELLGQPALASLRCLWEGAAVDAGSAPAAAALGREAYLRLLVASMHLLDRGTQARAQAILQDLQELVELGCRQQGLHSWRGRALACRGLAGTARAVVQGTIGAWQQGAVKDGRAALAGLLCAQRYLRILLANAGCLAAAEESSSSCQGRLDQVEAMLHVLRGAGGDFSKCACPVGGGGSAAAPPSSLQAIAAADLTLGPLLAEGSYGEVYRALWHGSTPVAVKRLKQSASQVGSAPVTSLQAEVRALAALQHPNIVRVYGLTQFSDGRVGLVQELWLGGALCGALQGVPLPLSRLLSLGRCLAMGLAYSHSRGVVHNDLKSATVLVKAGGEEAALCDFGLARGEGGGAEEASLGTVEWAAPENLVRGVGCGQAPADVYSLGCVLAAMGSGRQPWQGCKAGEVVAAVAGRGERPGLEAGLPHDLKALIQDCWRERPGDRPTAMEVARRLGRM